MASLLPIFLLAIVAVLVAAGMLVIPYLIHPPRKHAVKQMPYESGMDPVGDARGRFDVQFYLIAIVFLLFDVELLFLYPWAVAAWSDPLAGLGSQGLRGFVLADILVFMGLLGLAYAYAWRKGVFHWR
jgi:NADH-quinone oxidoreductase subunit A